MKLIGVVDEDPFDHGTWSGLSRHFFLAVDSAGLLHSAFAASTSPLVRRVFQAVSVQPDRRRWRFKYHLNTGYRNALTASVRRRLMQIDNSAYDLALQVGAWYDLPKITPKPVVSYHDGSLAALLKSPYGYPPIASRHIRRTLEYERNLYGRLSLIFPMSKWLAGSFMTDNGVSLRKLVPVGAGINLPRILPVRDKDYGVPRILFVGKDFRRKGGPDLLEAFAIVRREVKHAELVLVGPTQQDWPDGVRSIGALSKARTEDVDRLLDEYAKATLFVMPSLYEPFGVVFGEAMAHYCPCIGTNICAMPEIIDHGETGYVTPPNDPKALAKHMIAILKEPAMARTIGEKGYEKYRSTLTWDAVVAKMRSAITTELGIA